MPRTVDRAYWDSVNCYAVVTDVGSPTTYRYGRISVPVERATSTTTITTVGKALGTDLGGNRNTCIAAYVYNPDNSLAGSTSSACTFFGGGGTLTTSNLTLPVNGAISVSVAQQNGAAIYRLEHSWIANGT